MATKSLGRELGLVDVIKIEKKLTTKHNTKQEFDFLFVLDFEATCWEASDRTKKPPEIIEFSVVLYDARKTEVVAEFQQYVMPTEVPKLSEFCKNFTGISQETVDDGVPLQTCLMLFMRWIKDQMKIHRIEFTSDSLQPLGSKGVFVTWSDWDLDICLKKECKRKAIIKPDIFSKWIDLRALYKEYYSRRPKGLNGALSEVGLKFMGKEHCGLDDAKNTAFLAGKMIADGVALRITKDLTLSWN